MRARSRSIASSTSRCTSRKRASSRRAGARAGPGATSSRARRSAHCSGPASRTRSTGAGASRRTPTRSWSSRRVPAPAASLVTCCAPVPRVSGRCTTCWSRRRRRCATRNGNDWISSPRTRHSARSCGRLPTTRRLPCRARDRSAVSLDELPALELTGVVFANELLDNLPFGLAQRSDDGWLEVRVAPGPTGELAELLVPAEADDARGLDEITERIAVPTGARLPIPRGVDAWFAACSRMLRRGTLIVDRLRRRRARSRRARPRRVAAHVPSARARHVGARCAGDAGHHGGRRSRAARAGGARLGLHARLRPIASGMAARSGDRRPRRRRPANVGGAGAHRRPRRARRPQPRRRGARADGSRRPRRPPRRNPLALATRTARSTARPGASG